MIDSRGPRFGAAITTVVLAVVLVIAGVSHLAAGWLLLAQTLVFAVGALAGLRYAPYGAIFRHLVRPRLGPPERTEPEAPPRFSQGVGMVFAGIGVIGFAAGLPVLGIVFAAFALAAAFLNAAFDFCLGCQMYLFIQRIRPAHQTAAPHKEVFHP
jgi:MFS family permease